MSYSQRITSVLNKYADQELDITKQRILKRAGEHIAELELENDRLFKLACASFEKLGQIQTEDKEMKHGRI